MNPCIPCEKDFSQENIDKNGPPFFLPGETVFYSGEYDVVFGITEGDNLNTIVAKIAAYFSQATTSTSTTSTSTTTTTSTSTSSTSSTTTTTTTAAPTTHSVSFAVTDTALDDELVTTIPPTTTISVANGASSFQFTVTVNNRWFLFSEPSSEPLKTGYTNGLNNEPMNDYTFKAPVVVGSTRYYYTRAPRSTDGGSPTILHT